MFASILEQSLIAFPLLIGAYLIISLLKLPDFSIESAYLFGAVAAFLAKDLPIPLIILSAMSGGMLVGSFTGFLNQKMGVPFLLAAIITNGVVHGATQYFLGASIRSFHIHSPLSELHLLIGLGGILAAGAPFLLSSQWGYSLAIYGNNPRFFAHHHMKSAPIVFSGVMAGHGLAGISGFLFAQSSGFVDLSMNFGIILLCLTALMLGRLVIRTQVPHLFIPIFGIAIYFLLQQTLLRLGLNLKYFNAFQALLILSILLIGKRKPSLQFDHLGV